MAAREVKYLGTYNSLLDEHLCEYLSRPSVWRHLRRQELVRESGEVVGEEEWRAGVERRAVRSRTDRERGREEDKSRLAAKHRHRQQLLKNYALADRIRLQAERHHPAYVREEEFTALSQTDTQALGMERKQLTVHLPHNSLDKPANKPGETQQSAEVMAQSRSTLHTDSHPSVSQSSQSARTSASIRSLPRQSPYLPRPPKDRPLKRSPKRGVSNPGELTASVPISHKRRVIRTVQGGTPYSQSKATITLMFRGRGIKLNGRTLNESRSEVCVYQQHCGGNAVEVYHGLLVPFATFSFVSKRHMNATLGLTFYLNGLVDTRLSACCEYRYRPGHRVGGGGKASHYEFLSVSDATPCFRCQAEIEVDKFIAAGDKDEEGCEEKAGVENREIKEAWVNTSQVNVSTKEVGYSSSDFESEDADKSEGSDLDRSTQAPAITGERSVSRGSSISSNPETSSVSLDSELDASHSDSEMPEVPTGPSTRLSDTSHSPCEVRGYSSSLGHVTPDERLLTHSALSENATVLSQISEQESSIQDCIETDQSSMFVPTNTSPTQDIATSTPLRDTFILQESSGALAPLQPSNNTPPDPLSPIAHSDDTPLDPLPPSQYSSNTTAGPISSLQHSNNTLLDPHSPSQCSYDTPPDPLSPLAHSYGSPPDTPSSLQHSITLPDALQPSHDFTDSPHSHSSYTRANSSSAVDVTSSCSNIQVENELEGECRKSQSSLEFVAPSQDDTLQSTHISTPAQRSGHSASVSSCSPEPNASYLDTNTPAHLISSATNTHNHSSDDVTISSSSELDPPSPESPPYSLSGESLVVLRNLTPSQLQQLASLLPNEIVNEVVMENTRNFSPDHLDEILGRTKTISRIRISKSEFVQDFLEALLKHLKSVEDLEISHSDFPPDHFNAFLNQIPKSAPKLTKFSTSHCNISFGYSLTHTLNSMSRLRIINLSGNVLKSAINFELLHTPDLQELYLDNVSIDDADLIGLCEFLRGNAKVHTLSLRGISFSNAFLQRLLDVMQENRTIKELLFSPQPEDLHIDTKLITDILDKRAI